MCNYVQIEPVIYSSERLSWIHFIIIVRWNEWPVGIAHNYTALFSSILGILSPFSLWKHIKLSSFSYSVVILFLPISYIPPCFHANPPNFPHLIEPRVYVHVITLLWSFTWFIIQLCFLKNVIYHQTQLSQLIAVILWVLRIYGETMNCQSSVRRVI